MMNSLLKTASAAMILLTGSAMVAVPADDGGAEHAAAARAAAKQLGGTLKARLARAIKAEGPVAAIKVCAEEAYSIAAQVSDAAGMDVGRSALKLRNPGNAPDAWEQGALARFLAAQERGEDLSAMEHSETVRSGGEAVFYWAKPILVQKPCTVCHGTSIVPEVAATLADYYPDDQATGFEIGDLRGIFTVKKRLP